jgi:hypothetical protein
MAKKAKKAKQSTAKKIKQSHLKVASHPGTTAMIARVTGCNKPPILWRQQGDGSWMECFLKPDCTYGNCQVVDKSQVPPQVRNGG